MGRFVEVLTERVGIGLKKYAEQIQKELRAEVKRHCPDTRRDGTITIRKLGEREYFVGTNDRGLFFLDRGSRAVYGKHMVFPEPKGWVNMGNVRNGTVHITNRKAIPGVHFVRAVADRHR